MHLKLRTQCALEIMVVVHDDYDYDYYYYSNLGFAQIEHQCIIIIINLFARNENIHNNHKVYMMAGRQKN